MRQLLYSYVCTIVYDERPLKQLQIMLSSAPVSVSPQMSCPRSCCLFMLLTAAQVQALYTWRCYVVGVLKNIGHVRETKENPTDSPSQTLDTRVTARGRPG